jgi:hypothetical protein
LEKGGFKLLSILKKSIIITLAIFYITLIINMIAGGITAGIFTILPVEDFGWTVSHANYLGYFSVCSFAPFSTLMLFGMAFLGIILLIKYSKYMRRKIRKSSLFLKIKMLTNKM